jgi:FHA domain-containing protein
VRDIVADKRCENGHFIDESWDLCPYCPQDESEPDVPVVRPTRGGPEPVRAPQPSRAPVAAAAVAPPSQARHTSPSLAEAPPMERTIAVSKLDPDAQAKRYVVGWLVGLNASSRGEAFPVRMGRNVLGRDRRSDVVVNDDQASSHHADLVFRPEEQRFILMDHNSTNGTYVNEAEIEPRRDLATRDIIRIGGHKFLFVPLCAPDSMWDLEGVLK